MRGSMGHPAGLTGLTFPAGDEPVPAAVRAIRHTVATAPELRRDAVIDHVPQHVGAPAVLDEPEGVAAELEVIPPLVDAVGTVPFDVDAAFHIGDQVVQRGRARLQPDVGDPHDRYATPPVRPVRPARTRLADLG